MGLQLANVTRDRKDLFNALAQAYDTIYVPAFPEADERESLEKMHNILAGRLPGVDIIINLMGENLKTPDEQIIKGVGIAYYYHPENVGLLAYNAVAPEFMGEGIGKALVHSRIESLKQMAATRGKALRAAFIECNDPAKVHPSEDCMDPAIRIKIFSAWGARPVPLNYIQPPLAPGQNPYHNLKLLNYPVDGVYAGPADVEAFVLAMYRETKTKVNPHQNPHVQAMLQELGNWKPVNDNRQCELRVKNVPSFEFV
ncbi:MAG: hypothetical protein ACXW30_05795 [Micavibrio sp.]